MSDRERGGMWIPPRGPGMVRAVAPGPAPAGITRRTARLMAVLAEVVLLGALGFTLFIAYGLIDNRWYHLVAVTGGSMAPTILPGDLIVLTRPPAEVRAGMILTLEVDNAVVTHRVVEVHPDGTFVTQGDANDVRDDFRGLKLRVIGEVRLRIPAIGGVLLLAQSQQRPSSAWFEQGGSVPLVAGGGTWPDPEARSEPAAATPAPDESADPLGEAQPSPRPRPTVAPAGSTEPPATDPSEPAPTAAPTAAAPSATPPAPSPLVASIACPSRVTAGQPVTCENKSSSGPGISYTWYVDGAAALRGPEFWLQLERGDHALQLAVTRGTETRWSSTVFVAVD